MAGRFWRIRGQHEDYDPYTIYLDTPTFFTLKIFHGGQFTKSPDMEYKNGKTTFIDTVDYEDFGSDVLNEMLYKIEYHTDMIFYYFFKIPYVCLDLGLNVLNSDSDFKSLCDHVRGGTKLIEIYVEHRHSTMLTMSLDVDDPSSPILAIGNEIEVSQSGSDDEDDPDYIEDEDNQVEDVEVDMLHFRSCVDFDEENLDDDVSDNDSAEENNIKVDLEKFDNNSDDDLESTTLKKVHKKVIRKKKMSSIGIDASVNPFYIGQLIEDKQKLNDMVKKFALHSRRQIYIGKNEALRYRIICLGSSPNLDVGEHRKGLRESLTSEKIDQSKKVTKRKTKPTCPFAIHISRPSIKNSRSVFIER
ncbi:hypothetical protein R6Q59_028519 [Mikania micrantha]